MAEQNFIRSVNGREIKFRRPNDTQMLLVGRLLRRAESVRSKAEGGEADEAQVTGTVHELSKILDIIDSMVVDEEDRSWLEDQMVLGAVDMSALTSTLGSGEDEEPKKPAKKSARARTR